MNKNQVVKPQKKSDHELFNIIDECIRDGEYIFKKHAKQRQSDRKISDLEVLDILEGKQGRKRRRNKSKDIYKKGRLDWNYCIEGCNRDEDNIRVIISFDTEVLLVITVIRIN